MSLYVVQVSWKSNFCLLIKSLHLSLTISVNLQANITSLICIRSLTNTFVHIWSINGGNNKWGYPLKCRFMAFMRLSTHWWIMKYLTKHMSKCIFFFFFWAKKSEKCCSRQKTNNDYSCPGEIHTLMRKTNTLAKHYKNC